MPRAQPSAPDPQRPLEIYEAATRLVDTLLELGSAWPGDEAMRRALVMAAVGHGRLRRAQGRSEDVLFDDYDRLRGALWARIRETEMPPGGASEAILGLDSAVSLAVAASLRGYYHDVIARSGEWPTAVERLVWEWRHHSDPRRG